MILIPDDEIAYLEFVISTNVGDPFTTRWKKYLLKERHMFLMETDDDNCWSFPFRDKMYYFLSKDVFTKTYPSGSRSYWYMMYSMKYSYWYPFDKEYGEGSLNVMIDLYHGLAGELISINFREPLL